MKTFIDKCTTRSRAVIFSLIVIIIAGLITYINIPKESNPDVKIPIILVFVPYDGISPEDAVNLLVKPLEKSFKTIQNVKKISASGMEGGASVLLEFIAGVDNNIALQDVRAKVDDTMYKLPSDTKRPKVSEVNLGLEPIISVVLSGDMPERTILKIARDMKDALESLPSILEVNINGDREEALEIIIKPEVIESYKLSLAGLVSAISSNNKLVPAGILKGKTGEYAIKVQSVISDYEEFLDFPVKAEQDIVVRLRDVAEVRSTFKAPDAIASINGKTTVVFDVTKRLGSNLISTTTLVKEVIKQQLPNLPSNLEVSFIQDSSYEIKDMVADLENSIIIGVILVMIVMILTIGLRSSALVSLSIPASFFAGILVLNLFGFTLNVVVLFSLILTIGMIVDDAIVVSEYADRKMIEGVPSQKAFTLAANRMLWPILSSTLVKIVVFMPLLFWPGVMGQFMKYMPITVIAILTSSLVFALLIQPSLGPYFGTHANVSKAEIDSMLASENGDLERLTGFSQKYAHILGVILDKPKKFICTVFVALIAVYAIFIYWGAGTEFFPNVEPDRAVLVVQSPGNMSLEKKNDLMQLCENKLHHLHDDIDVFYTSAGKIAGHSIPEGAIGTIVLEFKNWKSRRKAAAILADVRKEIDTVKGITFQILQHNSGPRAQKPIAINLASNDQPALNKFNNKFTSYLSNLGGIMDIEDGVTRAALEWSIKINRSKAAKYLLDVGSIGRSIQLVTNGFILANYRPKSNDEEVDILLRFPEESRNLMQIKNLKVINANGDSIYLSNIAEIVPAPKVGSIKRIRGINTISVSANVADGLSVESKMNEIKAWLIKNQEPMIKISFEGDEDSQKESANFLIKAFVSALVAMFFIMLVQFNNLYHSIVIMSAVALSTGGVLLGLLILNQPFSIVMSGIGIIALAGIVLNNNIIFVDTYQHLRAEGMQKRKAIIMSGVQRFRPIILTALTALLGLLPMVFGITIDFYTRSITYDAPSSQMWRPLASSIAGGLAFATWLTLLFTPCLLLLEKIRN